MAENNEICLKMKAFGKPSKQQEIDKAESIEPHNVSKSIHEDEKVSPAFLGLKSCTGDLQIKDEVRLCEMCKTKQEHSLRGNVDLKHSKASNVQNNNRQLQNQDTILQEMDCLFHVIQECYKQFTGRENVPGTLSINDKNNSEHEKIKTAHLQIYTIMGFSKTKEKIRQRGVAKNKKRVENQADKNTWTDNQNNALLSTLQELSNVRRNLEIKVANLEEEKEKLLTRLSEIAGSRLRDGNPLITDLNDINRPNKLAERFSELYDNEWSDAIEKMPGDKSDEDKIGILLSILTSIYTNCHEISKEQLHNLQMFGILLEDTKDKPTDLNTGISPERKAKEMQLLCGSLSLSRVKKKILSSEEFRSNYVENFEIYEIYIERCIDICWFMNIQEVPMCLDFAFQKRDPFRHDLYRPFTKSGNICDYLVWPLLLLHEGGPVMQRGVIQPL